MIDLESCYCCGTTYSDICKVTDIPRRTYQDYNDPKTYLTIGRVKNSKGYWEAWNQYHISFSVCKDCWNEYVRIPKDSDGKRSCPFCSQEVILTYNNIVVYGFHTYWIHRNCWNQNVGIEV